MKYLSMLIVLLGLGGLAPARSASGAQAAKEPEAARPVVAIADFSGDEPATGRFISDTLLTDLSQSHQMRLVERSEIRKAMDELKLQDTLVFDPQQTKALSRLVRADELVVGSYLVRDGQLMVNARLIDLGTGRVVSGGASNVTGDARSMFAVVHRLAHLLHHRITGADFVIDGEGAQPGDLVAPPPVPATRPGGDQYRVHENGDQGAARDYGGGYGRAAAPVVVPVPEPVYVPTYYPYYYPTYYSYPYAYSPFSFSLGIGFGFGGRRGGFEHFGSGGHGFRGRR